MDPPVLVSNTREARIQEALDYRRTRSFLPHYPSGGLSRTLSTEEEDELEARAGDSGYLHSPSSGTLRDGDFPSPEFFTRNNPAGLPAIVEAKPKTFGGGVIPTLQSPSREDRSGHLHSFLELVSILAYLATFGMLGVIVRYLLEVLFGPGVARLTSNRSALFVDLPANMLGCFFMGWVGVVFKKDIAMFSEHLAIGLSTGLMGSITTYTSMMQRNLVTMVTDSFVTGVFGLLIGSYLAQMSLVVGEDSARLLLKTLNFINEDRTRKGVKEWASPSPDNLKRRKMGLALFLFLGGGMWAAAVALTLIDKTRTSRRTLWLACSLAPPGVWTRWYLARLNGRGLGKHRLKWFPIGTFIVNVAGSSFAAGLTTVENAIDKEIATFIANGITLGTLGCLSTLSTFAAEIQVMHEGSNRWRSYAYPLFSMATSLLIGALVYGVPAWLKVGLASDIPWTQ